MKQKRQLLRHFAFIAISFVTILSFQNCSQFRTLDLSKSVNSASSSPSDSTSPSTPTQPPDYNSDVLKKMQVNLGVKGNSNCQMQPPVIPDFDLASDGANVLKVCADSSKCPYQTINSALASATSGSVIAVAAGTYEECIVVNKDNITFQGRAGRPYIHATGCGAAPWIGAVFGIFANNTVIENFEISDNTGLSVIAVGIGKAGVNLTMNNLYIHDMISALYTIGAGNVIITNNYVDHTGRQVGGDPHTDAGISIGMGTSSFSMKNTVIAHPRQNGGMLSTVAYKSVVDCLVAADLDGGLSTYMVSFGWGFDSTLTNSVVQRGPLTLTQQLVLYWERDTPMPQDQFTAKNNILISDRPMRDRPIIDYGSNGPTTYA
ncbi:MAG TPA: hypothetical protein VN132_10685, partial [Bdellovibrio sp.]|nr:hypothetical protein [Bdellovibrio sp.]